MARQNDDQSWAAGVRRGRHVLAARNAEVLDAQFIAPLPKPDEAPPAQGRLGNASLTVRPDPIDFRDYLYAPRLAETETVQVPDVLPQRPPVRNQGREGSCTGQALAAVIDMQNARRRAEGAEVPERMSARMLYETARLFDEFPDDRLPGSSARGAIKAFWHNGVCSAALAPYIDGDQGFRLTAPISKEARNVTLGAYFRLRHVLHHYQSALAEAKGIFCTAMIHDGWDAAAVKAANGFIKVPDGKMPEPVGAHAFAIVGYDTHGFIVLNSWGEDWGGLSTASLRPRPVRLAAPMDMPGIAHWSYADWAAHVLDAWVLRLQAPCNRPSDLGGYRAMPELDRQSGFRLNRPAEPKRKIVGSYLHVKDGRFVSDPPYGSSAAQIDETIRHLTEGDGKDKYDALVFYAHGGVTNLGAAAESAAALADGFKRNRIWPIFYFWRTGLDDVASDLLRRLFGGVEARATGLTDLTDTLLEEAARPLVKPFWREMKSDAALAGDGDAVSATARILSKVLLHTAGPKRVHFVGHSAGAIFLGELLQKQSPLLQFLPQMGTISLLAPACTLDFFRQRLQSLGDKLTATRDPLAIYNLSDETERDDVVGGVYRKSILYLVSNALEEHPQAPLAGMDRFMAATPKRGFSYILSGGRDARGRPVPPKEQRSQSGTHGDFDNDARTMNDVAARILGLPGWQDVPKPFLTAELKVR